MDQLAQEKAQLNRKKPFDDWHFNSQGIIPLTQTFLSGLKKFLK